MPTLTEEYEVGEVSDERGAYPLIRSLDRTVRKLRDEFYEFRREANGRLSALEKTVSGLDVDVQTLKTDTAVLKHDVADLKSDVKELRSDVSDIKGDLKAISAKFDSVQTRFNWGLVILGLTVALIQMLK
ncbi:MAG: hypothetical protein IJT58_01975 [Synergistaceae bacterium]|nr:hypothetical protein [Synergistaceae bacterium]